MNPGFSYARDPILGFGGWTSNLKRYASLTSGGAQIYGRDDPRAAVETLVTAQALLSLMPDGSSGLDTLERQIAGAYAAFWWTDTILLNTITVNQGHDSRAFTKLHDGTFVQRGSAEAAELFGTREIVQALYKPDKWWYKFCVRVTGAQRDVTLFGIWNSGFTSCVGPANSGGVGSRGEMVFLRQSFPFGVTVSRDATTGAYTNNLGRGINTPTPGSGTVGDVSGSHTITLNYAQGSSLSVTDAMGQVWSYLEGAAFAVRAPSAPTTDILHIDFSSGVAIDVKDALGHTTLYHIGGGRVASVSDPLGATTRAWHDRFGNVVRTEDALGNASATEYDAYRRKTKETAPEGNAVEYAYDAKSNVIQTTKHSKPGSGLSDVVTSATYDSTCNVPLTETDPLSHATTYTINTTTCLRLTTTGPAVGGSSPVTTLAYNSFGQVNSVTDPTGLVTTYSYNTTNGNMESAVVDPGSSPHIAATTAIAYDTWGNITSLTDPNGNAHTGTYDARRRLTQYTAPTSTSAITKWTYDVDGLITKIERATSDVANPWAATNYAYWLTGRVKTMTDPDGRTTRYAYDANNRLLITTDPELRRVFTQYDLKGQVAKEIRAYGTPLQEDYATYTYSANGQKVTIKDARTNQTAYTFDGFDRLITTTFPDATYEAATYDAKNNALTKRNRAGVTETFTYDSLDRMSTKVMPLSGGGNLTTTWVYDLAGRVTDLSDSAGHDLAYTYDTAKRMASVARQVPGLTGTQTVAYLYDAVGNRTRITWPDSYYVQYQYDALNRMTTANENGTYLLATYTYDKLSRRSGLVYGNGAYLSYAYTQGSDLLTLAHNWQTSGGAATGNSYTHTFTKAHQLASASASDTTFLWEPAAYQTNSYASANNLNQYTQVTFGGNPASTITNDANGNMTSDGVLALTYDAENRLLTAAKSGMSAAYTYDPMGKRVKKVVDGTTTFFLLADDEEIADYDGSGNLLRRYVTGPGTDEPIAMVGTGGTPTRDYFHESRNGNVVAMTDNADHISQGPFTYDAYGQSAQTGGVPFRFTGRRLDPETGLYYYRARYYSAALGRFLQTDSIGYKDQMNLYGYVDNDPINLTDSSGRWLIALQWGFEGAAGPVGKSEAQGIFFSTHDENGNFNPTIGFYESEGDIGGGRADAGVSIAGYGGDNAMNNLQGKSDVAAADFGPAAVSTSGHLGTAKDSAIPLPSGEGYTPTGVSISTSAPGAGGNVGETNTKIKAKISAGDVVTAGGRKIQDIAEGAANEARAAAEEAIRRQTDPN